MAQFIQNHAPVILAASAGAIIGAGTAIVYQKTATDTNHQLRQLAAKIEGLCREVNALKNALEASSSNKKKRLSGYYSIHASSGDDDDDVYEEAVEG